MDAALKVGCVLGYLIEITHIQVCLWHDQWPNLERMTSDLNYIDPANKYKHYFFIKMVEFSFTR